MNVGCFRVRRRVREYSRLPSKEVVSLGEQRTDLCSTLSFVDMRLF
jgi:hypothetical protein